MATSSDRKSVIAIDGPVASGKSTVGRLLAERLGYLYVDTGAMYRALTLKAVRDGVNLEDEEALVKVAHRARIDLGVDKKGELCVLLDGRNVTRQIRTPEITNKVFYIAKVGGVRKEMVSLQRKIARGKAAVVEGRDIGTVVFPNANKKFYLGASFEERTRRRYKELCDQGRPTSLKKVEKEIALRNGRDKTRKIAPLRLADDAVHIDTTNLTIDGMVDEILSHLGKDVEKK